MRIRSGSWNLTVVGATMIALGLAAAIAVASPCAKAVVLLEGPESLTEPIARRLGVLPSHV